MLLYIFLFLAVYIIVSYTHIQLYKRNVSIFWIRVVLISGWLLYIGMFHKPSDIWSTAECCTFWAFVAAHLLTGDYHTIQPSTKLEPKPTHSDSSKTEGRNKFISWLSTFIILAWIFDDDDE